MTLDKNIYDTTTPNVTSIWAVFSDVQH
jgi:hypothetical protein